MLKKRLFFIAFAFFLHSLPPVFGQDASLLQQQDWSNVRVDNFSDAQIKRLVQAAEERNISVQNIQEQALIRGMPRTEINKLLQRIRRIQSNSPNPDRASARLSQITSQIALPKHLNAIHHSISSVKKSARSLVLACLIVKT